MQLVNLQVIQFKTNLDPKWLEVTYRNHTPKGHNESAIGSASCPLMPQSFLQVVLEWALDT